MRVRNGEPAKEMAKEQSLMLEENQWLLKEMKTEPCPLGLAIGRFLVASPQAGQ
jgi:hypothetical protein